ncbi:MAG: AzlD domain-containing protein [Ilumatobacteraceae bacterium]
MTWLLVLSLAAAAYLFKVTGLVIVGGRSLPPVVERCLALVPAALISALIVKDTVSVGDELVLDARLPGVLAAVVGARLRAPLIVVIILGASVTAAARAAGLD